MICSQERKFCISCQCCLSVSCAHLNVWFLVVPVSGSYSLILAIKLAFCMRDVSLYILLKYYKGKESTFWTLSPFSFYMWNHHNSCAEMVEWLLLSKRIWGHQGCCARDIVITCKIELKDLIGMLLCRST